MRRGEWIQDALHRGLGVAARHIGEWYDVYRPHDAHKPLDSASRFMRLPASFLPERTGQDAGRGHAVWHGVFDASYTRPGDYISDGRRCFFIVAQDELQPVLCIHCNRTVSFRHPTGPPQAGLNGYGGVLLRQAMPLMTGWPASIVTRSESAASSGLPGDIGVAKWSAWLPSISKVQLRSGDLLEDDLNQCGIVAASELSVTGWRLTVVQAAR